MKKQTGKQKATKPLKKKALPKFSSEAEERTFWSKHDSVEYFDWQNAKTTVFPNLKPSTKVISLRLPEHLLHDLKVIANKMDVPYQSLMKIFLSEKVHDNHQSHH